MTLCFWDDYMTFFDMLYHFDFVPGMKVHGAVVILLFLLLIWPLV